MAAMYQLPAVKEVDVEGNVFPPTVKPPSSTKTMFLGGAGVRVLEIGGKFVNFTAIGVYLEDHAVPLLSAKWKGKSADELTASEEFFRDIVTGAFEKFIRVTLILPLSGEQYSEKVSENCVAIWKEAEVYTEEEAIAIQKFLDAFRNQTFPPTSSILFTQLPVGSLRISFSKNSWISEEDDDGVVIENKLLSEAVLESIIGKYGVCPAAKKSIAERLSDLMNQYKD